MNDALWDILTDEELAQQCDEWRYQADRDRAARRWGRAKWAGRMSASAWEALETRRRLRQEALGLGEQLVIRVPQPYGDPPAA